MERTKRKGSRKGIERIAKEIVKEKQIQKYKTPLIVLVICCSVFFIALIVNGFSGFNENKVIEPVISKEEVKFVETTEETREVVYGSVAELIVEDFSGYMWVFIFIMFSLPIIQLFFRGSI